MSEPQQQTVSSQNWWIRLCRWLWKHPFRFIWSTLFINIAINIGSTWLITSFNTKAIPETSIVGSLAGWISTHWLFSCLLFTISGALLFVTWLGSRWPDAAPATDDHTQMSAHDREYMLRRLRLRYEQMLSQSLQGVVRMELGLAERPTAIQKKPRQDLGNSNVQYPLQKEMFLLKLSDKKFYRGFGAFCVEHHKNGCCCHRLY